MGFLIRCTPAIAPAVNLPSAVTLPDGQTASDGLDAPRRSQQQTRLQLALEPGDLLATMTAGAYGAVQAGTYNTRPLVPEVLVKDGKWALIRPRQSYEELIGMDRDRKSVV